MTAEEARNKTKGRIMEFIPLQYGRVMADIEKCIAEGNFVLYTNENLYSENKQKLIEDGFKVSPGNGSMDGYASYKISWKDDDKKNTKKSFFSFRKR